MSHQQHLQGIQPHREPYTESTAGQSFSGTDLSTSNENLSYEQRFVLRNYSRVEPQGQENLDELLITTKPSQTKIPTTRYSIEQRFSSINNSIDSARFTVSGNNNNITTSRNVSVIGTQHTPSIAGNGVSCPNRNSLKDTNSNRSSMDVSSCSYNTLIIHPDDQMYASSSMNCSRDYSSPSELVMNISDTSSSVGGGSIKKDRPQSYGEQAPNVSSFGSARGIQEMPSRGIQEITGISDDYLNQSHVLKHLAKDFMVPIQQGRNIAHRDSKVVCENTLGAAEGDVTVLSQQSPTFANHRQQSGHGSISESNKAKHTKTKSKSQPDLTKMAELQIGDLESITNENQLLKQQLYACFSKVSKTQKLEDEMINVYSFHEELKKTCERREKLERAARLRLQCDLNRVQDLNRVMKDQMDILQNQLMAPTEHQLLIAQLFTHNKELMAAKDRNGIELVAQRATLQEQRNHIGILDAALTNAQQNIRCLEEDLRKKQHQIEQLTQQQHHRCQTQQHPHMLSQLLQPSSIQSVHLGFESESEMVNESNRSGYIDNKWELLDKNNREVIMRIENDTKHSEDQMMYHAAIDMKTHDDNKHEIMDANSTICKDADSCRLQEDRIALVKYDKMRYLEEVNSAQRKVKDLQAHLKMLENKLSEKDTEIRSLQNQNGVCASSKDSNNRFGPSSTGYNQQTLCSASSQSYNNSNGINTTSLSMFDSSQIPQNQQKQHHHHHHNSNQQIQNADVGVLKFAVPSLALTTFKADSEVNDVSVLAGHAAVNSSSYSDSSTAPYDRQTTILSKQAIHSNPQQIPNYYSGNTTSMNSKSKLHQEHQLDQQKSVDDQLMSKVSKMSLAQVTYLLEQKQRELSVTSRIIRDQIASSREIVSGTTNCCRIRLQDTEEFC